MLISNENIDLLGFKYKIKAALFDIVSGNSNIDHPLCDECADKLIEILDEQLKITQEDYDDYRKYYKILQNEKDIPKLNDLEKELGDLIAEEKRLVNELEYIKVQLDNLQGKDVFTAAFHIWYNGHLGTINNFRLGRLPSVPVDWSEINAAWGQTTLLLSALAGTINLTFERYKLVPYANHSYIEVIGEQKKLPLYGSGGFKFVRNTEFDSGMVAFLDCLQQFQDKVANLDKDTVFRFPYRTNKGKIGDKDASYSIRIQLNSEEQWTKALKFVLTNLKWGVTFVASLSKSDGDEILQSDN
ncbi:hypothetical protein NQ314_005349 [Rhamnusium bicolor]|uniref:Atg6 BARA domain-containing protein n=1 Tax=Rhamnusium bicolor TaxID=1586634 RepID=A0AAV8ZGR6_9CUCU|nr:hypothetical protein NQ314_005349 [Rhamnusium bicolor]